MCTCDSKKSTFVKEQKASGLLSRLLRQPGFAYSVCGPITKHKDIIQKFKETGDSQYIYENESDKACFQQDMTYGGFK